MKVRQLIKILNQLEDQDRTIKICEYYDEAFLRDFTNTIKPSEDIIANLWLVKNGNNRIETNFLSVGEIGTLKIKNVLKILY